MWSLIDNFENISWGVAVKKIRFTNFKTEQGNKKFHFTPCSDVPGLP